MVLLLLLFEWDVGHLVVSSLGRLGMGRECVGFLYGKWIAVCTPYHKSCLSGWRESRGLGYSVDRFAM